MPTHTLENNGSTRERHEQMTDGVTIGRLATLTGVSAKAIRYYEEIGLLPRPLRGAKRYRRYGAIDVNRVRLLRRIRLLARHIPWRGHCWSGGRCALRGRPDGGDFAHT